MQSGVSGGNEQENRARRLDADSRYCSVDTRLFGFLAAPSGEDRPVTTNALLPLIAAPPREVVLQPNSALASWARARNQHRHTCQKRLQRAALVCHECHEFQTRSGTRSSAGSRPHPYPICVLGAPEEAPPVNRLLHIS